MERGWVDVPYEGNDSRTNADLASRFAALVAAAGADADPVVWWRYGTASLDRFSSPLFDFLWSAVQGPVGPGAAINSLLRPPSLRRRLSAAAGFVVRTLSRRRQARRVLADRLAEEASEPGVYVIRTWLSPAAFEGGYRDPYFGDLEPWLRQQGERVITVAGVLSDYETVLTRIAQRPDVSIYPEELFLSVRDVFRTALRVYFDSPRLPAVLGFMSFNASPAVRASLDSEKAGRQLYLNELQRYVAAGLARHFEVSTVAVTYENLAWEKVFHAGTSAAVPQATRIGYQHAPVYPAMTTFAAAGVHAAGYPAPDRVVTSGPVGFERLAAAGVPVRSLVVGPTLKSPPASMAVPSNLPKGPLLVILGEYDRSLALVRLVLAAVETRPSMQVLLRLHPLTPRERFLEDAGPSLPAAVRVSDNASVADDLAGAGVVAYDASAVALEALLSGIPIVHLDLGDPLSFDPLYDGAPLRWEADSVAGLLDVLDEIAELQPTEYSDRASRSAQIAARWYAPPDDELLMALAPDPAADGKEEAA